MAKAQCLVAAAATLVAAAVALPGVVLIGCALGGGDRLSFPPRAVDLRWFDQLRTGSWPAIWMTTFTVCAISMVVVCGTAVPLAFLARRVGPTARVALFVAAAHSVLLPLVLYGLLLRRLLGFAGLLGHPVGLALAHASIALPLALWSVYGEVARLRPDAVLAARSIGASWWGSFRVVVWPVIRRGVSRAAALAAVVSLGDVTFCVYLGRTELQTVGSRLWTEMQFEYTPLAAAASVVLVALGAMAYAIATNRRINPISEEG